MFLFVSITYDEKLSGERLIHYSNHTPSSEPVPACPDLSGKLFREGWEASLKILTPPRNIYPVLLLFLLNYFSDYPD